MLFVRTLLGLAGLLTPGDVTLFDGTPGGVGNVRVFDEDRLLPERRPPGLQGIRLGSVDFIGRSELSELLPGSPRLRTDLPGGATRIELPAGQGSLYAYARPTDGGERHGFFLVDSDGSARSVLELDGRGAGQGSPFLGRVALDGEGRALLVATHADAGGRLLEVDLTTGTLFDHTGGRRLGLQEDGLVLCKEFGLALTARGVLRFPRGGGSGVAQRVAFEGTPPAWIGPDVACSADTRTVVFLAGPSRNAAHLYRVEATGSAVCATKAPTGLERIGYLPEFMDGPYVAVSPDGSTLAWIQEDSVSREVFFRETHAQAPPEFQITADVRFVDTLSESGVIAFYSPDEIVMLLGDDSGGNPGLIEDGDFYGITLPSDPNAPLEIRNLSGSSGDLDLPFLDYGTQSNGGRIHRLPGRTTLLVHDTEIFKLSLVEFDTAAATVFDLDIELVERVEQVAGGYLLEALVATGAVTDRVLYKLTLEPTPTLDELGRLPSASVFQPIVTRADGTYAAIATWRGDEWMARVAPDGVFRSLTSAPAKYGPTLDFTERGDLVTTFELPDGTSVFGTWGDSWRFLTRERIRGFVLP